MQMWDAMRWNRIVVAVTFLLAALGGAMAVPAKATIQRAYVDARGQVHVVYGDGRDILVPPENNQVSSEAPEVAPDGETVGWLVEEPNCCTSYPVPMTLVIFKSGKIMRRLSDGMMLYKWRFAEGGRRVAVSSGTVHGMNGVHLTLYDVRTGRRLKTWDGGDGDTPPEWGAEIAH